MKLVILENALIWGLYTTNMASFCGDPKLYLPHNASRKQNSESFREQKQMFPISVGLIWMRGHGEEWLKVVKNL